MIAKILNSTSSFNAVFYNDKKVENGKAELLMMKNFPSYIKNNSSYTDVKNYFLFQSSSNKTVKDKQFHATISTKGREHSKEELKFIAEEYLKKMGYEKQPYIVVFHNDTNNNHVHIVSSRINIDSNLKINDSYEKYKSVASIQNIMENHYGIDNDKKIENLLSYSYSNLNQLQKLLETNDFKTRIIEDKNKIEITHNNLLLKSLNIEDLDFKNGVEKQRIKQIYAILNKYKDVYFNSVFKILDDDKKSISYNSELQIELKKKFGLDLQFSFNTDKQPFGYTIIDNKTKNVIKGSDVIKMNTLFNFTEDKINKKYFDILANLNINENKEVVKLLFKEKYNIALEDSMIIKNDSKVSYLAYNTTKNNTIDFIRNFEENSKGNISIYSLDNKHYVFDSLENKIFDMKKLVGVKEYEFYLQNLLPQNSENLNKEINNQSHYVTSTNSIEQFLNYSTVEQYLKNSSSTGEDEEQERKRKKRTR